MIWTDRQADDLSWHTGALVDGITTCSRLCITRPSVDAWSFGVLLYELWSRGGVPYSDIQDTRQCKAAILAGKRISLSDDLMSEPLRAFIMDCLWAANPLARPKFGVMSHVLRSV